MKTPISKRGQILTGFTLSFFYFLLSIWPPSSWLAFVFLIPLLQAVRKTESRAAVFLSGWIYGLLYFSTVSFWITNVAWWIFALAIIYHGFYIGLFTLTSHHILRHSQNRLWLILALPSAWIISEWLRSTGFLGLPTGLIGYQLIHYLPFMQLAEFTGIYGISFAVVLINAAIFVLIESKNTVFRITAGLTAMIAVGIWWSWGFSVMQGSDHLKAPVKVAVIQANTPNRNSFDENNILSQLNIYRELSRASLQDAPDIIIWPETAVPCFLFHPLRKNILDKTQDIVRQLNTPLLTGTENFYLEDGRKIANNSAVYFNSSGEASGRYDKMKLVPFMESAPFPAMIRLLRRLGLPCIYSPGKIHTVFNLKNLRFSSVICFETLFPDLIRKFTLNGAELFFNITNDSRALEQMSFYYKTNLDIVRIRAIENRRSFVRAANTGISAVIDPYGRLIDQSKTDTIRILTATAHTNSHQTIFSLAGQWIIILSSLILLGFVFLKKNKGKKFTD